MKKKLNDVHLGSLKKLETKTSANYPENKFYTGEENPEDWKQFFDFEPMYAGQEIKKDSAQLENYHLPDKWVHL